jgi:hypothetical protein
MTDVLRDNPSGMSDADKVNYETIVLLTKYDLVLSFDFI